MVQTIQGYAERYKPLWLLGRWSFFGLSGLSFLANPLGLLFWFVVGFVLCAVLGLVLPWLPWAIEQVLPVLGLVGLVVLLVSMLWSAKIAMLLSVVSVDWRKDAQKRIRTVISYLNNLVALLDDTEPDLDKVVHIQSSVVGAVLNLGMQIITAYTPLLIEQGKVDEIPQLTARMLGRKISK